MPRPRDHRRALALFYAAHFGHQGIVLPFLPLWFLSRGLTPAAIGVLLALIPLCKLLAPWTWGRVADRSGRRRGLLVGTGLAAATALAAFPAAAGLGALAAAVALYAMLVAPGLPFAEATALEQSEVRGFAYGRVRLWGSVSFVAVSLAAGAVVAEAPGPAVLLAAAGFLAVSALAGALFPLPRGAAPGGRREAEASGLPAALREAGLWRLLAACTLMQASHGAYYGFYSIRLEAAGYGGAAIGGLWALAVACEVALLTRIDGIVERLGTATVLRVALAAAAARWAVIALTAAPAALAAAQTLHALTYAAFHVAALREVHRRFRSGSLATGQALYSGFSFGLGIFCGTLGAGALAGRLGLAAVFGASTALALAGLLVAPRAHSPASAAAAPDDRHRR